MMTSMKAFLYLLLGLGVFTFAYVPQSQAKIFRNAYVAFELPEIWKCGLEQTEWICRSNIDKESKEAIIILTAKEAGPMDTMEEYEKHLNAAEQIKTPANQFLNAQIKYPAKKSSINDHMWLDGLKFNSEISNYFTRYLITKKDQLSILVTFSVHKDYYTKYSSDFANAVKSLRIIASKNILAQQDLGGGNRPGSETLGNASLGSEVDGQAIMDPSQNANDSAAITKAKTKARMKKYALMFFAFLALGAGAYFLLKSKK